MKKFAILFMLALGISFATQAQKRERKMLGKNLTAEQQTNLAVKKLALALDLTEAQQRKVAPLLATQIEARKAQFEKRKQLKESEKRPTAEERYAMENKRLDAQLAFQRDLKEILTAAQYEQFKKMKKMEKGKRMQMEKKKMGYKKQQMHQRN